MGNEHLPAFPLEFKPLDTSIMLPACEPMAAIMEHEDRVVKAARDLVEDLMHDYGPDQAGLHESLAVATLAAEILKAMHSAGTLTVPLTHARPHRE